MANDTRQNSLWYWNYSHKLNSFWFHFYSICCKLKNKKIILFWIGKCMGNDEVLTTPSVLYCSSHTIDFHLWFVFQLWTCAKFRIPYSQFYFMFFSLNHFPHWIGTWWACVSINGMGKKEISGWMNRAYRIFIVRLNYTNSLLCINDSL